MDLNNANILVVGDIMLDKYIIGEVERISPEAPVPIVHVYNEYNTLGGCGNVVRNIRELGAKVSCLASVGSDINGREIIDLLKSSGASPLISTESIVTTTKERVIAGERKVQMLRIDRENIKDIDPTGCIEILNEQCSIENYDLVIISDYGKGMITGKLMEYINTNFNKVIIDPKPKNQNIYGHPFLITPNEKECNQMGGTENILSEYILTTQGSKGMTLKDTKYKSEITIEADPVEIYNVSGAGDTVISIMAVCLSIGWNVFDSAYIANKCAAYVVTQSGTSVVPQNKFMRLVQDYKSGVL